MNQFNQFNQFKGETSRGTQKRRLIAAYMSMCGRLKPLKVVLEWDWNRTRTGPFAASHKYHSNERTMLG